MRRPRIRTCLMEYDSWCESESTICRQNWNRRYHTISSFQPVYSTFPRFNFTRFASRLCSLIGGLRKCRVSSTLFMAIVHDVDLSMETSQNRENESQQEDSCFL